MDINLPHELKGRVIAKRGPYIVGQNKIEKHLLYLECDYPKRGKVETTNVKALCWAWGGHASKIDHIFPGDIVKFTFSLSGRMDNDRKDKNGAEMCWTEVVIESRPEVLDSSQRKMYNNNPGELPLGGVEGMPPSEDLGKEDYNDLPF
jgi:hypothetical protein